MDVVYDSQIFLRQRRGGISRVFAMLIQTFLEDSSIGITPRLLAPWTLNEYLFDVAPGLGVRLVPPWIPRELAYLPIAMKPPRNKYGSSILHTTYYSERFLGTSSGPMVATVHDMIPESTSGTDWYTAGHLAKAEYVRRADLVVCVSHATRESLLEIMPSAEEKTVVVPNCVSSIFRTGLPRLPSFPEAYILYVGKRNGYKDFGTLLRAMHIWRGENRDVPELVAIGNAWTPSERNQIEQLGLGQHVHRTLLNDDELAQAYSNATSLVQTSLMEGFGITVLEGMAAGTPVVTSDLAVAREIAGNAAIFYRPGDAEDLAQALSRILDDGELKEAKVAQGLERVTQFKPSRTAELTAQAYRRLSDMSN